ATHRQHESAGRGFAGIDRVGVRPRMGDSQVGAIVVEDVDLIGIAAPDHRAILEGLERGLYRLLRDRAAVSMCVAEFTADGYGQGLGGQLLPLFVLNREDELSNFGVFLSDGVLQ